MTETKTDTQQQQMLRGTAWMTASNIISRLLGALYIIPWYAWMGKQGDQANALFGQGYNIYALFLLISTAGIPVAIAKQVSKYNTLGKMKLREQSEQSCIRKECNSSVGRERVLRRLHSILFIDRTQKALMR